MQKAGCFGDAVNSTTPTALIQFVNQQTPDVLPGHVADGQPEGQRSGGPVRYVPHAADHQRCGQGEPELCAGRPGRPRSLRQDARTPTPPPSSSTTMSRSRHRLPLLDTNRSRCARTQSTKQPGPAGVVAVTDDLATGEGTALWLDVVLEQHLRSLPRTAIQEVLAGTKTPEEPVQAVREQALKVEAAPPSSSLSTRRIPGRRALGGLDYMRSSPSPVNTDDSPAPPSRARTTKNLAGNSPAAPQCTKPYQRSTRGDSGLTPICSLRPRLSCLLSLSSIRCSARSISPF